MTDYRELSLTVRADAVERAADILRSHIPSGVSMEPETEAIGEDGEFALVQDAAILIRAWLASESAASSTTVLAIRHDLRELDDAVVSPLRHRTVTDDSWANAWKRHFKVLRVGKRLVVRPSWRAFRPRKNDLVIDLDPGMAFGTGQHETTRLCLHALEERLAPGATVLDLGAGSGILSIAAAMLGAASVDAVDTNPVAVRVCRENLEGNKVRGRVRCAEGSLDDSWPFEERPTARYDVVLANISARVVQELAAPIIEALRPAGLALVSGIIAEREQACVEDLTSAGGRIVESRADGDWRLLMLTTAV